MEWRGVRVAVVGGGGFLGSHVVSALASRGAEPAVPRTSEGWDFTSFESARRYFDQVRPAIVINCAARQGGLAYQRLYPADLFHENLLLGVNTFRAAQQAGVAKFVDIVAACSYPGYAEGRVAEDDLWSGPPHPTVIGYGATRRLLVVQGEVYRRQYGFRSVQLLMTNLYGPGEHFHPDRSHGLAALLLKVFEAKRSDSPHVVVWGTGRPVREWLFVDDAADAIVRAAEDYDGPEPLNVSVGHGVTITELADLIRDVVGYRGDLVYDPEKPDGALMKTFSNESIRAQLGWAPRTPLREGIARTLAWLDEHYESAVRRE